VPYRRPFSGQFAEHEAHLLTFAGFFAFPSQAHLPLPIRMARMATMTIAKTTKSTMTVGKFMR
jgi:hypothetical protein